MKKILCLFFLSIAFHCSSQQSRLFIVTDEEGGDVMSLLKERKLNEAKIIYGKYIYRKSYPYFMESSFRAQVRKLFPNAKSTGVGIIDWEGPGYEDLMGQSGQRAQKRVLAEFEKALSIAKELRPNVKWGFYGIPFRVSTAGKIKDLNEWTQSNEQIRRLMEACDILVPVIYDSYSFKTFSESLRILQSEYENAIKYGEECDTEVMPIIWHRYHKTINGERTPLMDPNKFEQIVNMLNEQKKGVVSGIIWWGAESSFFARDQKNVRKMMTFEASGMDYKAVINKYSEALSKFK